MLAGTTFIWAGFVAVLVSIALYIGALRDKNAGQPSTLSRAARFAFLVAVACVIGAAAVHATLLMTHRFDVNYVYHYSARELTKFYLFSTFWAGQEGSFLLWAFWTSVLGVFMIFKSGPLMERRVMPIYGSVLGFLLLLLIVKSPFVPYAPASPMDPVHPTDGMGMNPLLENPWMVVHPPTLFLGFSSLAATFSFALAALFWGDFDNWFRRTWPWALFSVAVLGFGVMLGGYWAYETLGWGGFWGWDPVENGPLVPWLGMVGMIHAAQVQRVRGGLKKTTLFLGLFPFLAALYETFLTRTGVLDKFSNHSFSTLGGVANSIILYGLLGATALSLFYLAMRAKKIRNEASAWENATSREFGMTLAIVLLLVCAVVTAIGMSAPLITQAGMALHWTTRQSSVDTSFYNKANFPIGVLIGLGMAVGPYLAWKATRGSDIISLNGAYVVSVVGTLLFFVASQIVGATLIYHALNLGPIHWRYPSWEGGQRVSPAMLVLFMACIFAIVANGQILVQRMSPGKATREPARTAGGYFAHTGVALLLLGVVCLVTYTRKDDPMLLQGRPIALTNLPYSITYLGMTSPAGIQDRNNKLRFRVQSNDGKQTFMALMPLAMRNTEGMIKPLARPAIANRWWGDLYFALTDGPEQINPFSVVQKFNLTKGQVGSLDGYKFGFAGFSVPPDVDAMVKAGQMPQVFPVTALLSVTTPDGKTQIVAPKFVRKMNDPAEPQSPEVLLPKLPGSAPPVHPLAALDHPGRIAIAFTGMDADTGTASFYVRDATYKPQTAFGIEVSTRPGIDLVWIGTILIALGGLLGMRRRALENRLIPVPDPPADGSEAPEPARRRARTAPSRKPAPAAMKGGN
jgi:cytochrome c-type biogenesis protein CcmF